MYGYILTLNEIHLCQLEQTVGLEQVKLTNEEKILDKAKPFLLVDEKSMFGKIKDMDNNLGNFCKEDVHDEDFSSLVDYIKSASFLKT